MRDLIRRRLAFTRGRPRAVVLRTSFGDWDELHGPVLAVCHPDWRGVRAAAHSFGDPVIETDDAAATAEQIVTAAQERDVAVLVVHGFPPGSDALLRLASSRGMATRAVGHSSMAQHGAEAGEARVMDALVELVRAGTVGRLGFVKEGQAEAFRALGIEATHTPNRAPELGDVTRTSLGPGFHVGVFAEPFWRKNVVTQLGAVAILGGTAHVMRRPDVAYLDRLQVVEHGELDRPGFLALQASTDLNLYVTLSECHPMGPLESYLSGVPALLSRTSGVFRDDQWLWGMATVETADDPRGIAAAARRLLEASEESLARARGWIERADADAARIWAEFTAT